VSDRVEGDAPPACVGRGERGELEVRFSRVRCGEVAGEGNEGRVRCVRVDAPPAWAGTQHIEGGRADARPGATVMGQQRHQTENHSFINLHFPTYDTHGVVQRHPSGTGQQTLSHQVNTTTPLHT
jgi:hypothetical protein